ncbi:hypothetical protein [Zhenpiania hominis]|uniref:Uncharacterized protein n=1 Tax=Zhenpiania hominis TaxID=2763644 RepID=A0A923NGU5_9FIRM|nr:hypothetical protein [Zhenpiania hominis]MBC6678751.1 hypothetical protein [Zhenpiania hominis]
MKWLALEIVFSLLFGILVLAAAHYQRGYWAVGAEVVLPIALLIILLRTEREI